MYLDFYGNDKGSIGANLITSGKSVTTLEAPKNPVVKPFIKPKQDIETVKQPAVTSEKPKTVERSHSQGSNNHNSNKESFNQKTEKNPNRNSAGENFVEKSGGINQEKTFRTPDSLLENKGTNNGRVSYQQSEKDLTKKLQDAYKNNSDIKIKSNHFITTWHFLNFFFKFCQNRNIVISITVCQCY